MIVQLKDICQQVSTWKRQPGENLTYIDIAAINKHELNPSAVKHISADEAPSRAKWKVQEGDILLSTVRPNLNAVTILSVDSEDMVASSGLAVLRINPSLAIPSFIFNLLRTAQFIQWAVQNSTGASYPAITQKRVFEFPFSLPPLDEQRRIAGILDEVSNEMRLTQKQVANLTDAIASFQADIFTVKDESRTLGKLCEINPKLTSRPGLEEAIPFVPMDSVGTDGVLHAHEQRLFKDVKSGYTHFKQDDILVAKITPCFENMKSCMASIGAQVGAGSTEFHVLRAKADANTRYLHWYMRQSSIYRVGAHFMRGSSGHRRIPAFYLDNLRLPVHGIDEQKAIADRFDSIQALIEKYQARLSLLNELHQSLSTQAFQGRPRARR